MSRAKFPQATIDWNKSNGAEDTVTYTEGPSLTRQEFAEECDINTLMAKYDQHVIGGPGNMSPAVPQYFDFAEMPQTLLEFMHFQADAQRQFMMLPAVVRREFDNDPVEFVAFASDPANLEQMRSWGLAPPAKPSEPPAVVEPPKPPEAAPKPS